VKVAAARLLILSSPYIVFVLRDGKYYLAKVWCVSDRRIATAEFGHGGPTTAEQREVQLNYVDSYDPQIEFSGPSEAMKSCMMPRR
jgi:hypothetical protein